jgi:hypothetical protein
MKSNKFEYLLNRLLEIFGNKLVSVVLFGSYARKNYSKNSDLDIIVVAENEKNLANLRKEFLLKFDKSLDIQVFTKEDVISNFEYFSPMFSTLILGMRILFDREMFFYSAFKNFIKKIIKENIRYCEAGKIWNLSKTAKNLEILQ